MIIGKKLKGKLSQKFVLSRKASALTIAIVVKILRQKNNMSQNKLAELTGFTQATISGIENNRISVGIERAKVLARVLKVHPSVIAFPDWNEEDLAA